MKTLIIAITLLSISILSFAQDSLYIYHTGGYVEAKSISSIDSIKFNSKRDSLYFHQGKTIEKYQYAYIDSISFVRVNTKQSTTRDRGVVIGGVCFATRNVNTAGTFVDNSTDYGYKYSWNSKYGYSSTSTTNTPNYSTYTGGYTTPTIDDTWISANDPSPAGWRVPTYDELNALFSVLYNELYKIYLIGNNVNNNGTTINGVDGVIFTDKTTKQILFLPLAKYRDSWYESGYGEGYYWAANGTTDHIVDKKEISSEMKFLYLEYKNTKTMSTYATDIKSGYRSTALSIRSVIR